MCTIALHSSVVVARRSASTNIIPYHFVQKEFINVKLAGIF
jgi:hypothetical protein